MERRIRWEAIALLGAALLVPRPAPAQYEPEPETKEDALAKLRAQYKANPEPELRYEIGKLLFEMESWDEAEAELEAYLTEAGDAISVDRSNEVQALLYQILTGQHELYKNAKALVKQKSWGEAKKALQAYLSDVGETIGEKRRAETQALMDEIDSHMGTVTFECNVQGAKTYLDDVFVGAVPLTKPLHVAEGEYLLEIKADGYKPASKAVKIRGGKKKNFKVILDMYQPMNMCTDVTCSGHGACTVIGDLPTCTCQEGYMSSGLDCLPPIGEAKRVKDRAIGGIVMSAVGAAGLIAGPILLLDFLWSWSAPESHLWAGVGLSAGSGTLISIGVPLGIEAYARYVRVYNETDLARTAIGARIWYIIGFCISASLMVPGMVTGLLPLVIAAQTSYAALAVTSIVMGIKAYRLADRKDRPLDTPAARILPHLSPIPGGVALGLSGTF